MGLNSILKEKNVRATGLDPIRQHHVFDTFNKIITETKASDMLERSLILQRIQNEMTSTLSTWKILTNQASAHGISKSNKDKMEIQTLRDEIKSLQQKKKDFDKRINDGNNQYDDICAAEKISMDDLQIKCQREVEMFKDENISNTQILQEYK